MMRAALDYLEDGYCVMPVGKDKKPIFQWKHLQETMATKEEVKRWWSKDPDANIGIITGKISNICVIDVDSHEGAEELKKLIPGVIPNVQTPNGGWHFYFANCEGFGNATAFLKDVDFRGEGGYIVAPPSIGENGKIYSIVRKNNITREKALPKIIYNKLSSSKDYQPRACSKLHANNEAQQVKQSVTKRNIGNEGTRDEDLFHLANCLVKGGMPHVNIREYLHFFASYCNPPFSEKETEIKIQSALSREKNREKSFSDVVRDWVCNEGVTITNQMGYNALQCVTREEKTKLRVYLQRLEKEGLIKRTKKGTYKRVEDNIEWLDIENASTDPFPIIWPLGVEMLVNIPYGGVVLVSGQQSAGKTAYLLNVARLNMNRGKDVIFISTETNAQGLKIRLEGFGEDGTYIKDLIEGIRFGYHGQGEIVDVIEQYNLCDQIVILDYLEVEENFWEVAGMLSEIFKRMVGGIAVVGLQMHGDRPLGGRFGFHKPEMVLTLKKDFEAMATRITIEKARWWANPSDCPEFKSLLFKIRHGCLLHPTGEDWDRIAKE